ncbi:hypothetical protein PVNG_06298 [Plasmodium vivax North Korean]|uniref:VIR protein n=1 Tax=Plasmodium vivax North Korean TaxID=1035514 RepID=A0A0J9TPE2_PLAVI|nr:hypothetical protein PVNG_06298 [Plasmodium vivax North Korean]
MPFPSDEFYNKLDKELQGTLVYKGFCHTIGSLTSNRKYMELCYKVVRFLTVNEYENNKKISCNHCKLLNYWIFDQIKSINREYETNINVAYGHISTVMSKIMNLYYGKNKSQCTLDTYVPYDDYWEARKEFYEYCLNYEEIKAKKDLTYTGCEKYRDYPKRKPHSLDKFKQILSEDNLKNCPNSDGETGGCDPNVLFAEFSKLNDFLETKNGLPGESSKLFLGLSKKDTATAASAIGVSLLGLTLFKVKRILISLFEYQIVLLILFYH